MTHTTPQRSDPLVSTLLAEDPDLRDIVEEFVRGLSDRVSELERALTEQDWTSLQREAHRLKGAGGSYGFPPITEVAARLEADIHAEQPQKFDAWIEQLRRLAAAAEAGLTPSRSRSRGDA